MDTDNPIHIISKVDESFPAPDYDDKLAQSEKRNKFNDTQRGESYKNHIHRIVVCGIYIIGVTMLILIFIRVWHFAVPKCWRWLDDDNLHSIERIIFSGIIISLASKYFKRYKILDE